MKKLYIFIGVHTSNTNGKQETIYTMYADQLELESKNYPCKKFEKSISQERIRLLALLDYLKQNEEVIKEYNKPFSIYCYINNDLLSFLWEEEYKKEHQFGSNTTDMDLWNEIIRMCQSYKISLSIKGENTLFGVMNKMENKTAQRFAGKNKWKKEKY